uniref:Peptidase M50 domain-containing protein n=2 Tax=Rhizochromulina marina TaxID=1034831 RepID=A0A7S2W3Z9_9STRA|mmetsp:Transcript_14219/g.41901  ORF Transcript_14219/g.41901 Transcript_14219/m.41901 type:complete len:197 (+) Transcript_14219:47-637(+)
MFDIAIAGPVFGFIASFAALIYGLTLTNSSPQEALDVFPALPEAVLSGNVLVDILCRLLCPPLTDLPQASMAFVHPYTVAGLLGLLVNSLNMLPIGTLDGGRALTAVAGRRAASIVGTLALVLLLAVSFIADLPIQMYWVFVVILFQRMLDVPALDEVTEVDGTRTAIFGVVLTLASFCMVSIPLELLSEAAQQLP